MPIAYCNLVDQGDLQTRFLTLESVLLMCVIVCGAKLRQRQGHSLL